MPELGEQVAAALLIAAGQGARLRQGVDAARALPAPLGRMLDLLGQVEVEATVFRHRRRVLQLLLSRMLGKAWKSYGQESGRLTWCRCI